MATSKGLWSVAKWKPVMNTVHPRSVLGPVLVNTFINDTHSGTECTLGVCAGDTKLGGAGDKLEGRDGIQRDPERGVGP